MIKGFFLSLAFCSLLYAADVPDFTLKNLDNQNTRFSELQGEKLTLIDFWATWCKPCVQSIPKLNAIYKTYRERGVELIGISVDGPRNSAKVKPFSQIHNMTYPILRDPNAELAAELSVSSYPTLLIVNAQNEIVYTHTGYRPGDEQVIKKEIETLLGAGDEK